MKKNSNILTYLISILSSCIGIFLNFYLARSLQAEIFGDLQYHVSLATTGAQFLVLGINVFLVKEANNPKKSETIFSKCVTLYCLTALIELPFIILILKFYNKLSGLSLIFVTLVSVLMGLDTILCAYYQGIGKYKITIIFENLLPKLCLLIISLVFLSLNFNQIFFSKLYLIFYFVVYLTIAIPFLIKNFKGFKLCFSSNEFRSIFFFFGVTITYSLGNNLTKVLQGSFYNNTVALGVISVSLSIISLVRVFTAVLDNIVKPLFSKLKRESNYDDLLTLYRFDTRVNSYVSIPLYLFFTIFADKFLLIFGESYTAYPSILIILSAANFISDLTGPNGTMLIMTGNEKKELFNGFAYFLTYFLFIFVFSFDEVNGLCYALLVGMFVVNLLKYIEVWNIFKKNPLDCRTIFSLVNILFCDLLIILPLKFISNIYIWFIIGLLTGISLIFLNAFVLTLYRKTDVKNLINIKL